MLCVCSLTLLGVTELKLGGHMLGTKWGSPVTKTECRRHRPILRHLSSFPRSLLTGEDQLQLQWKQEPALNISISTSFLQIRGDKLTCEKNQRWDLMKWRESWVSGVWGPPGMIQVCVSLCHSLTLCFPVCKMGKWTQAPPALQP